MKGIILAGGHGTRLYPMTIPVCKQLLPVYDKPMIYYPLSTLMLAGIREILIISTPEDTPLMEKLLGSGEHIGIRLQYTVQPEPGGLAQAFIIGEEFIGDEAVCLILGDNILFGDELGRLVSEAAKLTQGARVLSHYVRNPEHYGVVELGEGGEVVSIEEKPDQPKSTSVIIGIYFYDSSVVEKATSLSFSDRGEMEITDLNKKYLAEEALSVSPLGRGYTWFDMGTSESLLAAANFVRIVEKRQGIKIACLEEIAWRQGWIDKNQLMELGKKWEKIPYGQYLCAVAAGKWGSL